MYRHVVRIFCAILLYAGVLAVCVVTGGAAVDVVFTALTPAQTGITWVHSNGASAAHHLPETVGAGVALLDYDGDGFLDILLINSGPADFYQPAKPLHNALYRNNHDGTFSDVTERSGLAGGDRYGMGAAVGDYDNDGRPDVYLTGYQSSALFHNNGDGTFSDVTTSSGTGVKGWSTSAVWFDADNDGKLDLFVLRYVEYDKTLNKLCNDAKNRSRYCVPKLFNPTTSVLFHNEGNGKFRDVTVASGIASSRGKGLGVVASDVAGKGRMDLFVANDMAPNFLFVNEGGGKFRETGLFAGVAYSEAGTVRSGMGVDAADFDADGRQDLFVDNIDHQSHTIYHNVGGGSFEEDRGAVTQATYLLSGWGCRFFDYDNDGTPDLIVANGHPDELVQESLAAVTYRQPLLLFQNIGGFFRNVSALSGSVFETRLAGRGLAAGDLDNDGDLDVVVTANGAAPLLLRNDGGNRRGWLGLRLVGSRSNRDGVGASLTWTAGGKTFRRFKAAGGSYLSSSDSREILGVGNAAAVDRLEIRWPDGHVDVFTDLPGGKYIEIREGESAK